MGVDGAHHGNKDIANRFDGRLIPLPCFHQSIEAAVDLQHVGQVGEK